MASTIHYNMRWLRVSADKITGIVLPVAVALQSILTVVFAHFVGKQAVYLHQSFPAMPNYFRMFDPSAKIRTLVMISSVVMMPILSAAETRIVRFIVPEGTSGRMKVTAPGFTQTYGPGVYVYSGLKLGDSITIVCTATEPEVAIGIYGDVDETDKTTVSTTIRGHSTFVMRVTSRLPATNFSRDAAFAAGRRLITTQYSQSLTSALDDGRLGLSHYDGGGNGRLGSPRNTIFGGRYFDSVGLPDMAMVDYVGLRFYQSAARSAIVSNVLLGDHGVNVAVVNVNGKLAVGASSNAFGDFSNYQYRPTDLTALPGTGQQPGAGGLVEIPVTAGWPSERGYIFSTPDFSPSFLELNGPSSSDGATQPEVRFRWKERPAAPLPPQITSAALGARSINAGSSINLTVTASGTGDLVYQWYRNGVGIRGAQGASLAIPSATSADEGTYAIRIVNIAGEANQDVCVLSVYTPPAAIAPTITDFPGSIAVGEGGRAQWSPTIAGTPPFKIEWRKGLSTIAGATTSSYLIPAADFLDAGTYTVVVTNLSGSASASGSLFVNARMPVFTAQPLSISVVEGQSATFTAAADFGSVFATYTWRKNGVQIAGGNGAIMVIPAVRATDGGEYTVTVMTAGGVVSSSSATLTVLSNDTALVITNQPAPVTVPAGNRAELLVMVTGTSPSFQWSKDGLPLIGKTSAQFVVPVVTSADEGDYSVRVTNSRGHVDSVVVHLTVSAAPATDLATAPTISNQPAPVTVTEGDDAIFAITAGGTAPLTAQWKIDDAAVSGATSTTFIMHGVRLANSGRKITCMISNAKGSVTSAAAVLTVKAKSVAGSAPTITVQPSAVSVREGSPASFAIVAAGTGPLSYTWLVGGIAGAGANSASFTLPDVRLADSGIAITCRVTNAIGAITSSATILTVLPKGGVAGQPAAIHFDTGVDLSAPRFGTLKLAGTVKDASGVPVANATMRFVATGIDGAVGETDSAGHFSGSVLIPSPLSAALHVGRLWAGSYSEPLFFQVSSSDTPALKIQLPLDLRVGNTATLDNSLFTVETTGGAPDSAIAEGLARVGTTLRDEALVELKSQLSNPGFYVLILEGAICGTTLIGNEAALPVCYLAAKKLAEESAISAAKISARTFVDVADLQGDTKQLVDAAIDGLGAASNVRSSVMMFQGIRKGGGLMTMEDLREGTIQTVETILNKKTNGANQIEALTIIRKMSNGDAKALTLIPAAPIDDPSLRLKNVSVIIDAGTGESAVTTGFIQINATQLLFQGAGAPTLKGYGVTNAAPNLAMQGNFSSPISSQSLPGSTEMVQAIQAAEVRVGALKITDFQQEGALLTTGTPPQSGTTTISASSGGVVLSEGYVVGPGEFTNASVLVNLPTGKTGTIGFVATGPGTRRYLIRAVAQELGSFQLAGGKHAIVVVRKGSVALAQAEGESVEAAAAATAIGAFALNHGTESAALVEALTAGSYTVDATLRTGGRALLEVYALKP